MRMANGRFLLVSSLVLVLLFGFAPREPLRAETNAEQSAAAEKFLTEHLGQKGASVVEAFHRDTAAGTAESLEKLMSEKETQFNASLALVLSAWAGNEGAEKLLESSALERKDARGLLAIIGTTFIDQQTAIPLLIERLKKSPEKSYMRGAAGVVLAKITGCDFPPDPKQWEAWWAEEKKVFVPRKHIDWELMSFELTNSPPTSEWLFETGLEERFIAALKKASDRLGRFEAFESTLLKVVALAKGSEFDKALSEANDAVKLEGGNIYLKYMSAAMLLQCGRLADAKAAFGSVRQMSTACASAALLEQYCDWLAQQGENKEDKGKRIETLVSLLRKFEGEASPFGWDVASMYLTEKMTALDGRAIVDLAKKEKSAAIVAGCLLLMAPEEAFALLTGELKEKVAQDAVARYACLQVLGRISMGLEGEKIKAALAEMVTALTSLQKMDGDNGLYAALRVYVDLLGRNEVMDENYRTIALTKADVDALEKAVGAKKFEFQDAAIGRAMVGALEALRHPMPQTYVLENIGTTAISRFGLMELSSRLQANVYYAVVNGDEKEAARVADILGKMADKVTAQGKNISDGYLALTIRDCVYFGKADGLRKLNREKDAEAVIKERVEMRQKSGLPSVHTKRFQLLTNLPVPAVAEIVAEALLDDEIAFYKKYTEPEKN